MNFIQKIVQQLLSSFGLKRRLSALFQTLSLIIAITPGLNTFAPLLGQIAAWLGIVGITHAAISSTLKSLPLTTIAAFFNALILAAESIPALAPYHHILTIIAGILSALSTGS